MLNCVGAPIVPNHQRQCSSGTTVCAPSSLPPAALELRLQRRLVSVTLPFQDWKSTNSALQSTTLPLQGYLVPTAASSTGMRLCAWLARRPALRPLDDGMAPNAGACRSNPPKIRHCDPAPTPRPLRFGRPIEDPTPARFPCRATSSTHTFTATRSSRDMATQQLPASCRCRAMTS